MRQLGFSFQNDYKKEFGGSLLQGKRKSARPLSTKKPTHLILKCSGKSVFNPSNRKLEKLIRHQANKYGIKVYEVALNWSHFHLLIKLPSREAYVAFIRTVTSLIVSFVSKSKGFVSKGNGVNLKTKDLDLKSIFDLRPYTKILSWGKQFQRVVEYVELNTLEALGLIVRAKKDSARKKFCWQEKKPSFIKEVHRR